MFSTTGLFRGVPCPEGERCAIINCIFSHELRPKAVDAPVADTVSTNSQNEPEHKRRKLNVSSEQLRARTSIVPRPAPVPKIGPYKGPSSMPPVGVQQNPLTNPPRTLQSVVTPPPLHNESRPTITTTATLASVKPVVKESLNPRQIPRDPAGHAKRMVFLKYIHEEIKRLNIEVTKCDHPDKEALTLSENELVKAALDEEEQIARANTNVYPNIVKNRIMALKKMKIEDWTKHVLATFAKGIVPVAAKSDSLVTGLSADEEALFLDFMITDQEPLVKHGYVPSPPTEVEIVEAQAGVAASLNYEVCDRCKSRFRVYPDRREEDGALTTNGPCVYHWGRPVYPKREKTDAIKGSRETIYGCCSELLGTTGCTQRPTHVFKIEDPKRLASVLPFINTPENPAPSEGPDGKVPTAITFDCEMGYTVCGFELMRLTAVTWPEGSALIDVLVRPRGAILDFNTRFSGISPEAWNAAIPHRTSASNDLDLLLPPPPPGSEPSSRDVNSGGPMPIVDSPAAARSLLCSYITPSTPLLGHALENDLNVVRLCHPRIIDTVVLFPHPRGLPIRFGLKMLTKTRLNRDIQMGGANGHDSLEDARATGELVRYNVKKRWTEMKSEGWKLEKGVLMPPLPADMLPLPKEEGERVLGAGAGAKRQRIQVPSGGNGELGVVKKQKV